jgi:hypothetical protein
MVVSACGGTSSLASGDGGQSQDTDAQGVVSGGDGEAHGDGGTSVAPVLEGGSPGVDGSTGGGGECNPVQPYVSDATHTACQVGDTCVFNLFQTATSCSSLSGKGVQGDGCLYFQDCAPGYDCVIVNTDGSCARYCRYGAGFDDCGSEYTCTPFVTDAMDGSQEIGTCM